MVWTRWMLFENLYHPVVITITVVDARPSIERASWRAPATFLKFLSRRPDLLESACCATEFGLLVSGLTEAESARYRLPSKFRLKVPLYAAALATAPAKLAYLRGLTRRMRLPPSPVIRNGFQTYNTRQILGFGDNEFHAELFQPHLWNDNLYMREKNNCYAYASGHMPMRSCEPGYNATGQLFGTISYTIAQMISACQSDGLVLLPGGTKPYKLTHLVAAIAISKHSGVPLDQNGVPIPPDKELFTGGFHFLRYHWGGTKDARDNFWAGKDGCGLAVNTDHFGGIVRNPFAAKWLYPRWRIAGLFLAPTPLVHVYGPPQACGRGTF